MIAALEAELENDPENVRLLTDIAGLYYDLQSFDRAVDYFRRALERNPEDVNLRTDMGTALYYLGRPDEAIGELERALETAPSHPLTLFNLGAILVDARDDRERAIQLWEQLIAQNPGWEGNQTVQQEIDALRAGQ
jgi:tetratricopeptide (TPR) repeat protein